MKQWKNNYYTVTNQEHPCRYCRERIPAGSEVRTVNPKNEPRFWVCAECDGLLRDIANTISDQERVAFDDEGAWLANNDYLGKILNNFAERCKDDKIVDQLYEDIRRRNI